MTSFTEKDFDELVKSGAVDLEGDEPLDGPPEPPTDEEVVELAKDKQGTEGKKKDTPDPMVLDGDDIPEELRGKTPQEAAALYKALKDVSQNLANQITTRREPPPPPAKEPPKVDPFTADDLVEDGARSFNEKLEKFFETKTAPLQQQFIQNMAISNRQQALAQSEILRSYPQTLDKIIQENGVGQEQLAQPQTWVILESLVGRAHFDEIAEKRVAAKAKPSPELSAGVRATPEPDATTKLSPEELEVARALGVKPDVYASMKKYTNQG